MTERQITVSNLKGATRLDRVLREALPHVGRKAINTLIQERQVQVNGKTVWLNSWKVRNGDVLRLQSVPQALPTAPQRFDEAWLIAQDDDLIVVNKPAGLLAHTTRYGSQADLLTLARQRFGKVTLFHRLDRDTSGVVLLTRSRAINRYLDAAFKAKRVRKHYVALIPHPNNLAASGTVKRRLGPDPRNKQKRVVVERGGQAAITDYERGAVRAGRQAVHLYPQTGRTHQLRVHLAHLGTPILGDRLYSPNAEQFERLHLHAHQITLPQGDDFPERSFTAPVPSAFGWPE